jgi:hypothetical protein
MHRKTDSMKLKVAFLQLLIVNAPKKAEMVKYFKLTKG